MTRPGSRAGLGLAVSAAAGLTLLGLAARTARHRRRAPELPPAPDPTPAPAAPAASGSTAPARPHRVAVLLPVRDEEANLGPCLDGLLAAETPAGCRPPEIVVIDDGSRDATRRIADERAAAEPRLTVLDAGPLPPGWGGKLHALHRGWEHLLAQPEPPDWVLSTDADTRHHPRLLARALAAARHHRLDAVSVAGFQQVHGAGENLLTPPVFALLDAQLGDWGPSAVGDGPPVANGQFLLLRAAALERAGGFAAIRGAAIDDVGLVRALRAAGGRTGFYRAPDLLGVRMYRGLGSVHRGWRRNLGGLFGGRPGPTVAVLSILLLPIALLLAPLARGRRSRTSTDRRGENAGAGILWASGAAASALFRASAGHAAAWGLLYPLDALALAVTLAQGARDWRQGTLSAWKGRQVEAR